MKIQVIVFGLLLLGIYAGERWRHQWLGSKFHESYNVNDYGPVSFYCEGEDRGWKICIKEPPFTSEPLNITIYNCGGGYLKKFISIRKYIDRICEYIGCKVEVTYNQDVIFVIHDTSTPIKRILINDIQNILNGDNLPPFQDEEYVLKRWIETLFYTTDVFIDIFNIQLVNKNNFNYTHFLMDKRKIETKDYTDIDAFLKNNLNRGYHRIFENDKYLILIRELGQIMDERRYMNVIYPNSNQKQTENIRKLRRDANSLLQFKTADDPQCQADTTSYTYNSQKLIATVYRLEELERKLKGLLPKCDWNGGKWIFGDRGCEDDVYIFCQKGIVRSFEQGCE